MNPMQSPNTGVGKNLSSGSSESSDKPFQYYFDVFYEIPPTRSVRMTSYAEFAAGTEEIKKILKEQNPTWRILNIKRGLSNA